MSENEAQLASQAPTVLALMGVSKGGSLLRPRFVRMGNDEVHLALEGEVAVRTAPGTNPLHAVLVRGQHRWRDQASKRKLDACCRRRTKPSVDYARPMHAQQLEAGRPSAIGSYSDELRQAMTDAVRGGDPVASDVIQRALAELRGTARPELLGDVGFTRVNLAADVVAVHACGKAGVHGNMDRCVWRCVVCECSVCQWRVSWVVAVGRRAHNPWSSLAPGSPPRAPWRAPASLARSRPSRVATVAP